MATVEKKNQALQINCDCGRVHTLTVDGGEVSLETDSSGAYTPPPPEVTPAPVSVTPETASRDFLEQLFD